MRAKENKPAGTSMRWGWIALPTLWAVLVGVFYWDVLWAPADQILAGNDLANMFRPWLDYARSLVHQGELPLWNPYLFSGTSFVGDPQPALFYPPTWLALLAPTTRALGWMLVLHIWWAGLGATLWLQEEGASWWGALAGAAVFAFSGYTFARVQAGHLGVLTTGSWLPWGLLMLLRVTKGEGRRGRSAAVGAVCVSMALLAGHTATFVYLVLLWGAYALYQVRSSPKGWPRSRLVWPGVMAVGGLALASIQLFPLLENLASSTRLGASDYAFASRFSWPVGYLITLLVPNFFGEPVQTGYWGEGVYDELVLYVGVLPLLLMLVAGRQRRSRFWLAVGGLSLLAAFGSYGILHRLLYRLIPLFSGLRAPARAGLLFTVGAAALTALAVTALQQSESKERGRLLSPVSRPLTAGVLASAALVTVAGYMLYAWGRESNPAAGRMWHLAGQVAAFGLFFALAAGWLHLWRRESPSRWLPALALGLVLLDLWTLGAGLVRLVPTPPSAYWRIVDAHTDAASGRVLPWGLDIFEQNGALDYDVRSVFGYNPLEDAQYNQLTTAVPDPRARAYDLFNVRYVVTKSPLELSQGDTLSLLAEESGVFIYERATALPSAWIVTHLESVGEDDWLARVNAADFDPWQTALVEPDANCGHAAGQPAGDVIITTYSPSRIVARTQGEGGLAVFSERFVPGWNATLDGESVSLLRANGVLRAVCVPAGGHTIESSYRPLSLRVGAIVTGLALFSLAAMGLAGGRRRPPGSPIGVD